MTQKIIKKIKKYGTTHIVNFDKEDLAILGAEKGSIVEVRISKPENEEEPDDLAEYQ